MGRITLTREHQQWISVAAFCLATLLLLDGIYQLGMHARWRSWIPETLAANAAAGEPSTSAPTATRPAEASPADSQPADSPGTDPSPPDMPPSAATTTGLPTRPGMRATAPGGPPAPRAMRPPGAAAPAVDAAIGKRNPMTHALPKGHGLRLTGVLGNLALFATREGKDLAIELGKSSQGVKVTAMEDFNVTIEYEGKSETMKLFPEKPGPVPARPPASKPASTPAVSSAPANAAATTETPPAETSADETPASRPVGAER